MQSSQSAIIQILESSSEDQRIEVGIGSSGPADEVMLRYSTWTDGLGWCGQKTIRLDADRLDELHRALTVARYRINRNRAEAGDPRETCKVIQLPILK